MFWLFTRKKLLVLQKLLEKIYLVHIFFNLEIVNKYIFLRSPLVFAQRFIGTEKYAEAGISLDFDQPEHEQVYGEIVFCPTHLTGDFILRVHERNKFETRKRG